MRHIREMFASSVQKKIVCYVPDRWLYEFNEYVFNYVKFNTSQYTIYKCIPAKHLSLEMSHTVYISICQRVYVDWLLLHFFIWCTSISLSQILGHM